MMLEQNESDLKTWARQYKEGLGVYQRKMPEVVKLYNDFTGECFKTGAVDEKTKHMMALAISLCENDDYCIMYHTQEALHKGAKEQELLEVIAVAAAFGGGSAMSLGVTLLQQAISEGLKH